MTEPLPSEQAANAWQAHRPALEALSAELAKDDSIMARSLEGAMQLRDAILVELVGERLASAAYRHGSLGDLGRRIVAEARAISGHGPEATQAGGQ